MLRLLFSRIGLYLAGALSLIGVALGIYSKGRRDAKQKTALEAAERIANQERNRARLEDEIDQDTDLVARARAAGLVRGERP